MTVKTYLYFLILYILFIPETISAYIGPGVGISAIGSIIALIVGIIIAIIGFLWYPIKRLFGNNKSKEPKQTDN